MLTPTRDAPSITRHGVGVVLHLSAVQRCIHEPTPPRSSPITFVEMTHRPTYGCYHSPLALFQTSHQPLQHRTARTQDRPQPSSRKGKVREGGSDRTGHKHEYHTQEQNIFILSHHGDTSKTFFFRSSHRGEHPVKSMRCEISPL